MQKTTLIKALTLTTFFGLLGLFLLYKTGNFDSYIYNDEDPIQSSHNGGAMKGNKKAKDSAQRRKDSLNRTRMYSSKSMVITDEIRMSSSKSGPVFTPRAEADSAKKDTAKKK